VAGSTPHVTNLATHPGGKSIQKVPVERLILKLVKEMIGVLFRQLIVAFTYRRNWDIIPVAACHG
jgi:hypothetical protein